MCRRFSKKLILLFYGSVLVKKVEDGLIDHQYLSEFA